MIVKTTAFGHFSSHRVQPRISYKTIHDGVGASCRSETISQEDRRYIEHVPSGKRSERCFAQSTLMLLCERKDSLDVIQTLLSNRFRTPPFPTYPSRSIPSVFTSVFSQTAWHKILFKTWHPRPAFPLPLTSSVQSALSSGAYNWCRRYGTIGSRSKQMACLG